MILASSSLLEDLLEASLGPLRASWALLRPYWPSWRHIRPVLEAIVAVLEASWGHIGGHIVLS